MDRIRASTLQKENKTTQNDPNDPAKHLPDTLLTGREIALPYDDSFIHLTTTLLQTHTVQTEDDLKIRDAIVSLYRHVLPDIGHSALREYLSNPHYRTFAVWRSADDVLLDRARHPAEREPEDEAEDADTSDDSEDSDESSEDTSSFSGPCSTCSGSEAPTLTPPASTDVRPKDMICGAISYEIVPNGLKPVTTLYQLSLIGVRTKFQALGLGRRLVTTLKDMVSACNGDALVTYAGVDAMPFFGRNGFLDDPILTARYSFLPSWAESRLMVCPEVVRRDPVDVRRLDAVIDEWKTQWVQQYSTEVAVMGRLKAECEARDARIAEQREMIAVLMADNSRKSTLINKTQRDYGIARLEIQRLELEIRSMKEAKDKK